MTRQMSGFFLSLCELHISVDSEIIISIINILWHRYRNVYISRNKKNMALQPSKVSAKKFAYYLKASAWFSTLHLQLREKKYETAKENYH